MLKPVVGVVTLCFVVWRRLVRVLWFGGVDLPTELTVETRDRLVEY